MICIQKTESVLRTVLAKVIHPALDKHVVFHPTIMFLALINNSKYVLFLPLYRKLKSRYFPKSCLGEIHNCSPKSVAALSGTFGVKYKRLLLKLTF